MKIVKRKVPFRGFRSEIFLSEISDNVKDKRSNESADRNGKDPCNQQITGNTPTDCRNPFYNSYSDNGPCNGMCGADRNFKMLCAEKCKRPGCFSAEAFKGSELGNTLPHGFNNPPSPENCSERDGCIACHRNPFRNMLDVSDQSLR